MSSTSEGCDGGEPGPEACGLVLLHVEQKSDESPPICWATQPRGDPDLNSRMSPPRTSPRSVKRVAAFLRARPPSAFHVSAESAAQARQS